MNADGPPSPPKLPVTAGICAKDGVADTGRLALRNAGERSDMLDGIDDPGDSDEYGDVVGGGD